MKTNLTHLNNTGKYYDGGINQPSLVTNSDISSIITTSNSGRWRDMSNTESSIVLADDNGSVKITAEYLRAIEKNTLSIHLRLLVLEGAFTKEETDNIQKMLNSNDVASIELAKEILKNTGYEYIL